MMLAESSAREPLEPQPSAVVSFHEDGALDELLGIACSRFVDPAPPARTLRLTRWAP
jgi:hypothetical protein